MNIAAQPPVQADQTVYLKDYQNLHSWLNQLILIFKSMTIKQLLIQHWL